ncbi:MAG: sigma-70 family RNA polymerase sigma factor [Pirellulales bacterium]|nr:sigma-70 family RNA polymerase sigma factor [Pirellulales bacterium]
MVDDSQPRGSTFRELPCEESKGCPPAAGQHPDSQDFPDTFAPPAAALIEQLVAEHLAPVYRYAYRLTGSTVDAEDLTQQTFLVAQEKLGQLREVEAARAWLLTILRHAYLRRGRRRAPFNASSIELNLDAIPEDRPEETPLDEARLQQALNELPDDFKLVVLMFYFEDCSYREIAERLELPIGTVMSRLSRAKSHLRTKLLELELHAGR